MVDFRAAPIPQGLLDEYIRAKSRSPLQSSIGGLSSGMEKGLQLTEKMGEMKETKAKRKRLEDLRGFVEEKVVPTKEFQEMNMTMGGVPEALMKAGEYDKVLGAFQQYQGKKLSTEERKKIYDKQYSSKSRDYVNTRVDDLANAMKTLAPYGYVPDNARQRYDELQIEYDTALEKQKELGGIKSGGGKSEEKKIKVRDIKSGKTGTINESEFNSTLYERL